MVGSLQEWGTPHSFLYNGYYEEAVSAFCERAIAEAAIPCEAREYMYDINQNVRNTLCVIYEDTDTVSFYIEYRVLSVLDG